MHEMRGPEAARPDDWGAGLDSSFGSVIKIGAAVVALAFAILVLALILT